MLAIIFSWSLMIIVIYLGSIFIFKNSYKYLEYEQAEINLNKVNNAFKSFINVTNSFLLGSALWDEMYNYAIEYNDDNYARTNAKFLESFKPEQFQVNAPHYIDMVMLYTRSGELNPDYSAEFIHNRTTLKPISLEMTNLFKTGGPLHHIVVPAGKNSDVAGLMLTNKGLLILVAHSIRKYSGEGDSHGTLIYGRYVTETLWKQLLSVIKLNANFYTLQDIAENNKLKQSYTNLIHKNKKIIIIDQQTLILSDLLKDINGNNIGMLQVIMPRDLNLLANNAIKYFNYAFIIGGFIFSIVLFYALKLLLIQRLAEINRDIIHITQTEDFSNRIRLEGADELNLIVKEINKMLMSIEDINMILTDIINSMPSLLILVDDRLSIIKMNSFAEKMLGKVNFNQALQKPLFKIFPYLQEYKDKFNSVLTEKRVVKINKVSRIGVAKIEYLNVVIYPLIHHGQNILAIRIDEITDRVHMENQIEKTKKLSAIGMLMHDVVSEIDQPTQLILSKITVLKNHIQQVLTILKKYSEINEKSDMIAINELEKKSDIAHDFQEAKKIIDEIQQNANIIADIVKNLKINSRMEEQQTFIG
ncbi:MAG TPA: CHASE4 domain-containing protein [Gammaproteobacteria bacterium]|nr:CHASE4 domain-containing protein [Gammaproteobacteria bacterium]